MAMPYQRDMIIDAAFPWTDEEWSVVEEMNALDVKLSTFVTPEYWSSPPDSAIRRETLAFIRSEILPRARRSAIKRANEKAPDQ